MQLFAVPAQWMHGEIHFKHAIPPAGTKYPLGHVVRQTVEANCNIVPPSGQDSQWSAHFSK